uniref:Uncharacterized protein n=1 Tax=Gasterosteus aculeatus aculeatus TaxID=481459 RepID=A0AAQ4RUD1_GASAC
KKCKLSKLSKVCKLFFITSNEPVNSRLQFSGSDARIDVGTPLVQLYNIQTDKRHHLSRVSSAASPICSMFLKNCALFTPVVSTLFCIFFPFIRV